MPTGFGRSVMPSLPCQASSSSTGTSSSPLDTSCTSFKVKNTFIHIDVDKNMDDEEDVNFGLPIKSVSQPDLSFQKGAPLLSAPATPNNASQPERVDDSSSTSGVVPAGRTLPSSAQLCTRAASASHVPGFGSQKAANGEQSVGIATCAQWVNCDAGRRSARRRQRSSSARLRQQHWQRQRCEALFLQGCDKFQSSNGTLRSSESPVSLSWDHKLERSRDCGTRPAMFSFSGPF